MKQECQQRYTRPGRVVSILLACTLAGFGCKSTQSPPVGLEAGAKAGAAPLATHVITFKNQCAGTIWVAEFGNGVSATCTSNTDCNGGACTNGACTQILCTQDSQCNNPLAFCDAAACTSDNDCPAIACKQASDCPFSNQQCSAGWCTGNCQSGSCACNSTITCPGAGSSCGSNNLCGGGVCRYTHTPSPGYWKVAAQGSVQISIPTGWGGRFWPRTNCPDNLDTCGRAGQSCTQNSDCCNGQCIGPTGSQTCSVSVPACATGDCKTQAECTVSGSNPVSLFEPNFTSSGTVWYDVSLVDGYNVPISAVPLDSQNQPLTSCTTAGCTGPLNGSSLSSLQVLTTQACQSNSQCTSGQCQGGFCVAGYTQACDICTANSTASGLNCAANMAQYCCSNNQSCNSGTATCFSDSDCPSGSTCSSSNLCTPVTMSCASDSDCAAVPPPGSYICDPTAKACVPNASWGSTCCGPVNPTWLQVASPWVSPFKAACPTAYSYQFDDPSSLFTCTDTGQGVNYQVTFCP